MNQRDWRRVADDNRPSPARVYDFFLGGSHNFAVDRAMAGQLEKAMPDIGEIMRANRAFLQRAIGFLLDAGVRQFLDLGSGIPTVGNVHELAQRAAPEAAVVYVDLDEVAVAHSAAVLSDNPRASIVHADLRDVAAVLADPITTALLDFSQPVAVLLVGVLHQLKDPDPDEVIRGYAQRLAPGSYLVLSQASPDGRPAEVESFARTHAQGYQETMVLRTKAEVTRLVAGFDLVEPGVVFLPEWRPTEPMAPGDTPGRLSTYAAVGRVAARRQ
jgi:SAM-dependent methyltransferase